MWIGVRLRAFAADDAVGHRSSDRPQMSQMGADEQMKRQPQKRRARTRESPIVVLSFKNRRLIMAAAVGTRVKLVWLVHPCGLCPSVSSVVKRLGGGTGGRKYKRGPTSKARYGASRGAGDGLLSRVLSDGVPSALQGLTNVFGMGTGVAPAL